MKRILFLLMFLCTNNLYSKDMFDRLVPSEYSARDTYLNRTINLLFQADSTVSIQDGAVHYYGKCHEMNNYITISDFQSNDQLNFMVAYAFIGSRTKEVNIYVKKNGVIIWDIGNDTTYFRIVMNKIFKRKKYLYFIPVLDS